MRYASISGKPMFDAQGEFIGYRGIGKDITAQRENEARIHYLARNDELTGLSNRSSFQEQLAHAIRQSQRHGRAIAVLFIDLDRFKNINDTLGHDAGDTAAAGGGPASGHLPARIRHAGALGRR